MSRAQRLVLVIQHARCEVPGAIAGALEGLALRTVHTYRGEAVPDSAEGLAGLVVMGGPMSVYQADLFPHLKDEMRLIEGALDRGVPVLGVCLGSQLLASVLGARVGPGPGKELGFLPVYLTPEGRADPVFGVLPGSFTALHWHGDVYDTPPGAVRLAFSRATYCQAFRWGDSAYGLLFHLEVGRSILECMVRDFADEVREAGLTPEALLSEADGHLKAMRPMAEAVFGRWAQMLRPEEV